MIAPKRGAIVDAAPWPRLRQLRHILAQSWSIAATWRRRGFSGLWPGAVGPACGQAVAAAPPPSAWRGGGASAPAGLTAWRMRADALPLAASGDVSGPLTPCKQAAGGTPAYCLCSASVPPAYRLPVAFAPALRGAFAPPPALLRPFRARSGGPGPGGIPPVSGASAPDTVARWGRGGLGQESVNHLSFLNYFPFLTFQEVTNGDYRLCDLRGLPQ
jgi:hypothetical protein